MTKRGLLLIFLLIYLRVPAQEPITEIIRQAVRRVIVAVDLKIQRLQNETVWLQNAQKAVENTLSKLHLDEITDWVERQRRLYADYFEELRNVKLALTYFHKVKAIIDQQVQLVKEYKAAWALFQRDANFTREELDYFYKVYTGLLRESSDGVDHLLLVVNAFVTKMTDAERLSIIDEVSESMERALNDLRQFNEENKMVAVQRASAKGEIELVKRLYGF